MAVWIVWNWLASSHRFDPPPFRTLNIVLSIEAILVSTFVLISQNRMAAADSRRDHFSLQISLLAEAEMTNALRLLHGISRQLGLPDPDSDAEAKALASRTEPDGHRPSRRRTARGRSVCDR